MITRFGCFFLFFSLPILINCHVKVKKEVLDELLKKQDEATYVDFSMEDPNWSMFEKWLVSSDTLEKDEEGTGAGNIAGKVVTMVVMSIICGVAAGLAIYFRRINTMHFDTPNELDYEYTKGRPDDFMKLLTSVTMQNDGGLSGDLDLLYEQYELPNTRNDYAKAFCHDFKNDSLGLNEHAVKKGSCKLEGEFQCSLQHSHVRRFKLIPKGTGFKPPPPVNKDEIK